MWYSPNQDLALRILQEIHEGRNNITDLENTFKEEKDFVATLTSMYHSKNNAGGMLRAGSGSESRTFSIMGTQDISWDDPIQNFLKTNGYETYEPPRSDTRRIDNDPADVPKDASPA